MVLAVLHRLDLDPELLAEIHKSATHASVAYRSLLKAGATVPRREDAPKIDLLQEAMRAEAAKPEAIALAAYLRDGQPLASAYDEKRGGDYVDTLLELACKLENDALGPKGSGLE